MLDCAEHGCIASGRFQYRFDQVRGCCLAVSPGYADEMKPLRRMTIKVRGQSRHRGALIVDLDPGHRQCLDLRFSGNDCRRTLCNPHDAEDAFQATFLVLVRKAASIAPREMVGNWLYGVAHQTAVRLRTMAAKRGVREMQMMEMPEPVVAEARGDDLLQ